MSRNHYCPGIVGDFTASGASYVAGDLVKVGQRVAVALVDIADGATGTVQYKEVFLVAKTTTETYANGDILYYVAATKKVSSDSNSGANIRAGVAFKAAASADTTCYLALNE